MLAAHGYQGKLEEYKADEYVKFHEYIKYFIPIPIGDLLESDPISGKVTNIHWRNVKRALLQTLRTGDYVRLSETTMASTLSARLAEAEAERSTVATFAGFFKKPSPQAVQLVQWIVYGDLTKSEELLKANPALLESLLTEKVTVTDYSRRKVKQKTAFQAALCAMDDELCAMLARYMPKEEMARQYQAIFPDGHERYYQEQTPFDFSQIVQAVTESTDEDVEKALDLELPNDTALWGHLEQFRADFTNRSRQETVFNPQHLLKAFALYDSQYRTWNRKKLDLFWRQVVGFTQRFLPANTAMDFAQGLSYRIECKKNPARSFKFTYGNGSIFPLSVDFFSGLGYEYGACPGGVAESARGLHRPFSKHMSIKKSLLEDLCSQSRPAAIAATV